MTQTEEDETVVTVLPVTHTPPNDLTTALEIPRPTKARLGLEHERSWIVLTEANRFIWPGPELRPARLGDASSVASGYLPARFYELLKKRFLEITAKRGRIVGRTE